VRSRGFLFFKTKVKMEKLSEDDIDPDILASFAGQQQQ